MSHRPTQASVAALLLDPYTVRAPAWMFVQSAGPGLVSFVGASRIPDTGPAHPLRLGSGRTHQLAVGEMYLRPYWALGTDALRGKGLGPLVTEPLGHPGTLAGYLGQGELLMDPHQLFPLRES
ncbi:hypothetical protein [Streptacidiphilus sp. EB103A]|uniref:hypothetical protein n=1 Tax=Streptacidiphilus sp. EB103A TaxID=3156275 RepID=UPI003512DAEB